VIDALITDLFKQAIPGRAHATGAALRQIAAPPRTILQSAGSAGWRICLPDAAGVSPNHAGLSGLWRQPRWRPAAPRFPLGRLAAAGVFVLAMEKQS